MNGLSHKRILVTGASGFIGSALIDRFVEAGAHVVGVSRGAPINRNTEWHSLDLLDREAVRRCVARHRPDVIVHLAGITSTARAIEHVWPTFVANASGTVALLEAASQSGCERFVYCASMEEPRQGFISQPASPYGAAKWVGSMYTRMFHSTFGLPTAILRPFFVYGPGEQSSPTKLVPSVIGACLRSIQPRVSSPSRRMDWVYIDDVTNAFQVAIVADAAVGGDWDVGTGALHSISEFVDRVRVELDLGSEFGMVVAPDPERGEETSPVACVDPRLGWRASVPFEEGVRRTIEWYRRSDDERQRR
jgi:nucleoside-diphosphate-sugar epimerase